MRVRSLGWAGLEVVSDGASLVIDYVRDFPLFTASRSRDAYALPRQRASAALVTHLHEDHTDVEAIESAVGATGLVLRPAPQADGPPASEFTERAETRLGVSTLDIRGVADWERVELDGFTVTAVPAVDGLGDPQVNWVVEADGQRLFHGGDTMFHGYWWLIAQRLGPITLAALPINGAVVNVPHLQPASPVPAVLTPEQAVHAARILGADAILPIHHGVDQPPGYVEVPDAVAATAVAAHECAMRVHHLSAGDSVDLADVGQSTSTP
jgi:L-ascorbate metabolism protein UlaG (beta-lactamase superfamily)